MIAIEQYYGAMKMATARIIAPFLFIGGSVSVLLGILIAATTALTPGLFLLFCGIVGIAIARIIDLLKEIEGDLAAIRSRIDAGVLGLLRI